MSIPVILNVFRHPILRLIHAPPRFSGDSERSRRAGLEPQSRTQIHTTRILWIERTLPQAAKERSPEPYEAPCTILERDLNGTVDPRRAILHHTLGMTQVAQETPRRSSRVFMRVRVVVAGKNNQGRKFREASQTIVINAHGALIYLKQEM